VPRLFALDHNFPDPIVSVLARFQIDAELVRIDQIHSGMPASKTGSCSSRCTSVPRRGTV
jgi:hypothetical protein